MSNDSFVFDIQGDGNPYAKTWLDEGVLMESHEDGTVTISLDAGVSYFECRMLHPAPDNVSIAAPVGTLLRIEREGERIRVWATPA